jgi:PKD repeat protein
VKKLVIIFFFFVCIKSIQAQYFPYQWAHELGNNGPGVLTLNDACNTNQNHYVTVGKLQGTVDADPTSNIKLVSGCAHNLGNVGFIAEYDSSANLLKAFAIGGLSFRMSFEAVAVDAAGNYIIAGTFRDSANFDRNNLNSFIQATGASNLGDGFIAKYDINMNLLWVKNFPASNTITPKRIEIDSQNNIVIAGVFSNSIDIDPSAAVYTLNTYNSGNSSNDVFLTKLNPNGDFIWGKNLGSTAVDKLGDISIDNNDNIYIGVSLASATAFIDSSVTLSGLNTYSICIVKFTPTGQLGYYKLITNGGTASIIEVNGLKINVNNELYFTGKIAGNAYFQNPAVFIVSGGASGCDYIAKLNAIGDCEWAYASVSSVSLANGLDLDDQSNIYITGTFMGTKDFDYETGVANLSSFPSTSNNFYIASYNATGSYRWAYRVNTTGTTMIHVNNASKVWVQGDFNSNADFDPSATISSISNTNATHFLTTCTSNGTYQSANSFTGSGSSIERVTAIDASQSGVVITAGMFSGSVDFDPSITDEVLTSTLDSNAYLASYASTGGLNWINHIRGRAHIRGVVCDNAGNIYVTGQFSGSVFFDYNNAPASFINSMASSLDIFLGKYNANGVLQWMHHFGSPYTDEGHDIALDQNGNVVMTGIFNTLIDFDSSTLGVLELTTPQFTTNGYIAKYDQSGNFIFARKLVVTDTKAICTDNNNNVIVTGHMNGFGNFNAGGGNAIVYCVGGSGDDDYFMAKYDSLGDYLWAFRIGGSSDNNQTADICADNAGNIFFKGYFSGFGDSVDVDPSANANLLPAIGGVMAKYNSAGNFLWGNTTGFSYGGDIKVDNNGNPTIVGRYLPNVDLDPGPANVTLNGTVQSMVLMRYSAVGQYLDAQVYKGVNSNAILYPSCIAISNINEVYVGGFFVGSIDFDLSTQELFINYPSSRNGFLLALNQPNYLAQIPPSAAFNSNSTNFCEGVCINFQDNSLYAPNNWNWSFPGANPATSTNQNPQNICYPTAGTYNVQLIVSNPLGADTLVMNNYIIVDAIPQTNAGNDIDVCEGTSLQLNGAGAANYSWSPAATLVNPSTSNPVASPIITTTYILTGTNGSCSIADSVTITVNPNPLTPTITPVGGELQSTAANAYQWYFNGSAIPGATLQNIFPTQIGNYSVTVFNATGCFASSSSYLVTVVGIEATSDDASNFVIAPNPINDEIYVYSTQSQNNLDVSLYDISGKLIALKNMQFVEGINKLDFDISQLSAGIYRLAIDNKKDIYSLKVMKLVD